MFIQVKYRITTQHLHTKPKTKQTTMRGWSF